MRFASTPSSVLVNAKGQIEKKTGGYDKAELDLRAAESFGDFILLGRVRGAGSFTGTLPFYDAVALGGFLNLSGFVRNQIIGDSLAYGSVRVEKIVGRLPAGRVRRLRQTAGGRGRQVAAGRAGL